MTDGERAPLAKPGESAVAKGLAKNGDRQAVAARTAPRTPETFKDVDAASSTEDGYSPMTNRGNYSIEVGR